MLYQISILKRKNEVVELIEKSLPTKKLHTEEIIPVFQKWHMRYSQRIPLISKCHNHELKVRPDGYG